MGVLEITMMGRKKFAQVAHPEQCIECHTCELECPYSAIKVFPPLGDEFADMK
jgi:NAD-dependent dihydropyrimidine dehydrogenase PreA subunit